MSETYTKVIIKDLVLSMSIGIHDHEKAKLQRVLINVELFTKPSKIETIEDTVCYETISRKIAELAQSKHYDLAEVFAEDIAALCLENGKVKQVLVRVEKPDILENTKSVGVEILRP